MSSLQYLVIDLVRTGLFDAGLSASGGLLPPPAGATPAPRTLQSAPAPAHNSQSTQSKSDDWGDFSVFEWVTMHCKIYEACLGVSLNTIYPNAPWSGSPCVMQRDFAVSLKSPKCCVPKLYLGSTPWHGTVLSGMWCSFLLTPWHACIWQVVLKCQSLLLWQPYCTSLVQEKTLINSF